MKLTVTDAVCLCIREHAVLVEVCERARLVDVRGREAECVRLVVGELRVHEVVDLKTQNQNTISIIQQCLRCSHTFHCIMGRAHDQEGHNAKLSGDARCFRESRGDRRCSP